ncbi:MAG TPA: hypothetical protein VMS37_09815 [Verrucomicrobiae bacterium]|nr:hypothetical protein [Verrucomicrobiae bacterium]
MKQSILCVNSVTCLLAVTVFVPLIVHAQGYTITTVAGGNPCCSLGSGDGGPATQAFVNGPFGVAVDSAGNLYIADGGALVRKVTTSGIISTFAGDPTQQAGYSGDGGPATSATLSSPRAAAVDAAGNVFIADTLNARIRKVSASGTITTVAGGGPLAVSAGDGGPAVNATLSIPVGVAVDASGNLYIADFGHFSVRKVDSAGNITTIAGGSANVTLGNPGDGGPATSALIFPYGIAVDASGNLYIADHENNRIRKVTTDGIIHTMAGNGAGSYSGDGGPATQAGLYHPQGVAVDSAGNLYICATGDDRIRMVTADGTITTIAGTGAIGNSGDGGPATSARINMPSGIALGRGGIVYVADTGNNSVRLLTPSTPLAGSPPSIRSGGVVSASAFGGFPSIAPGSWIEIYGGSLAADSRGWSGSDFSGVNAPTSLDGTKVTIGGQAAFIDYISPGQVNAQVPSNTGTGTQPVVVTTAAGASSAFNVTVNATQPGLLAPAAFNVGGKQYIAALFSDGATYVLPPGAISGVPSRRAQPGDSITLYGIGFGPVTPNIPAGQVVQQSNALGSAFHLLFGGTEALVSYSGLAPNAVGLYQFNAVVPNVPSNDAVPVTFTLAGAAGSQTLYIAVQNGAPAPQLQSLNLSVAQVAGGGSIQGTVTLSAPAPAGGAVVALSSSASTATVPATVAVAAGMSSAIFTVSVGTVASNQTVTITASYGGISKQTTLMVLAPATAVFSSLLTTLTYSPTGYPSGAFLLTITRDAGNTTYTATNGFGTLFVGGTLSNSTDGTLTFTFNAIKSGPLGIPEFGWGLNAFNVSSTSMTLNLYPTVASYIYGGNISGTLTITGTPYPLGGNTATLSGTVQGGYLAAP